MNGKNKIVYILFVLLFISLCISCGNGFSKAEKLSVSIRQFESYAVTDMDELDATLIYTGESTDNTVATLLQGKWIYGNSEGTAVITVTDENTGAKVVYDVTVEYNPDVHLEPVVSEDRNLKDEDADDILPEHMGYVGYCYNVFSGNEFNQTAVAGMKQIFDWDNKVDFNYFSVDVTPASSTKLYSAKSKSEYLKAVEEKYSAKLSVKFFGHTLYSKTWSKNSAEEFKESKYSSRNQIYFQFGQISYSLGNKDGTNLGYYNYLKDDVKKALDSIASDKDVEAFINNYGTHVAVETVLGKSFEADFALIEDEKKDSFWWDVNNYYLLNPKEKLFVDSSLTNAFFKILCELIAADDEEIWQEIRVSDGFPYCCSVIIPSIESHLIMMGGWVPDVEYYDHLTDQQIYENLMFQLHSNDSKALISTKNMPEKSLVPIYELIPTDTQEGKNRKKLFIDYLEDKKEKK